VKPATQLGSLILSKTYSGLLTETTFGKAFTKLSERPQFREPFKATKLNKPSDVKCFFSLMISKHCLNIQKSDDLAVRSGYLSKWFTITCKSLTDSTANTAMSIPAFLIVPTPRVY
jgi:hypothetical protein